MRGQPRWPLYASVLGALLLALVPLPEAVQALRPYWLALVLVYWLIEDPDRVGLGFCFIAGLVADLATGGLLGEQALRLVVLAFIVQRFRARLRFFPIYQQALTVGALLLNDRIVSLGLRALLGEPSAGAAFWFAPLLGLLLWPPVYVLMDALRLGRWRR